MGKYIERNKVIDAIHQLVAEAAEDTVHSKSYLAGYKAALEMAELYVTDIPAADVAADVERLDKIKPTAVFHR